MTNCNNNFSSIDNCRTIHIKSESRIINGVYMRYPFRVRLVDSILYIMDLHGTENICHAFSYPQMEHINSYGKLGKGPNEFLDSENICFDQQEQLWVLDANRQKLVQIKQGIIHTEIDLNDKLIRTLDFTLYDDSTFLVPDYSGQFRYHIIDSKGNIIESRQKIPTEKNGNEGASYIALAQAWRPFMDYNPKNGILAMATQLGEVMELYDVPHDTVIHIFKGAAGEPKYLYRGGFAIPNGIMGYSDIHVGNQYIYAVFWGRTFEDIRQNGDKVEGGKSIHVFDLRGHLIASLQLDRHITGFNIDETHHKIIALDANSDQPLIEFSIPAL
ncbi:MAG: BF3164 family lipoprotein [Bacteroidales bacterium]|nr:BF3164 family lipoprotein [Bacteroidales bacterium]MDD4713413.1 BF3164 family lipoprotein [Bacteroidales bacterium]